MLNFLIIFGTVVTIVAVIRALSVKNYTPHTYDDFEDLYDKDGYFIGEED